MESDGDLIYKDNSEERELYHSDYFDQFRDIIKAKFQSNKAITLYRTCQTLPCSDEDKEGRRFRKINSPNPPKFKYDPQELEAMDDEQKYKEVTDAALSFNDSEEAAIRSAKVEDAKRKTKRQKENFRKGRGSKIGKFIFPPDTVLMSEMKNNHCNILTYKDVDIEKFRDNSYEGEVGYDETEG